MLSDGSYNYTTATVTLICRAGLYPIGLRWYFFWKQFICNEIEDFLHLCGWWGFFLLDIKPFFHITEIFYFLLRISRYCPYGTHLKASWWLVCHRWTHLWKLWIKLCVLSLYLMNTFIRQWRQRRTTQTYIHEHTNVKDRQRTELYREKDKLLTD